MSEKRKNKSNKGQTALVIVVCVIGALIMGVVIAAIAIRISGKNKLKNMTVSMAPELVTEEAEEITKEEQKIWKDGWIKHDGRIYEYNDSIVTFLFMGIDKRDETVKEVEEGVNGGQADALFLLVLDSKHRAVRVIAINRNTMVPVDVYNDKGAYVDTVTAQINTQHGFGNGKEESCEYQLKAVENLFFNIPIHGYFAINMKAVIPLTDSVGGVDLTVLEDVTTSGDHKKIFTKGETIHMDGETAYKYVSVRDTSVQASANGRLEREKQYLQEVMGKIKTQTKHDITTPLKIYNAISDQMVTNITAGELMYLVSSAGDYKFDAGEMYSMEGEYIAAEDNPDSEFDEFYADEDALKEMILEIFYDEVKID